MKVLIIPEDPTLDQHVLKPIAQQLFNDLGRSNARVEVLQEPHLRGVAQALNAQKLQEIIEDNAMIDLFIVMIDRDCNRFHNEEQAAARCGEHPRKLLACLAFQEVEVWALALHREGLPWSEVRKDCDPKERFWDPFVEARGWQGEVGRGRKKAMHGLGAKWKGLLQVCPELAALREEVRAWLSAADLSA